MAKRSFLDNLLNAFAKSADKAIKKAIMGDKRQKRNPSPARSQSRGSDYDVFKMMVDNHVRILNDSVSLVETSRNIPVIVGRKNIAIEQLDWFAKNKQYAATLNPPPEQTRSTLLAVFNEKLYSRVEDLVLAQIEKTSSLKTKSAKANAINKAELIIQDNKVHFDMNGTNYSEMLERIEILSGKVMEVKNTNL